MKINIGGSKRNKHFLRKAGRDWKIVDIRKDADFVVDLMQERLPFPKNTVEAVYTSHTLEHIYIDKLPKLLKDIYRVMAPNAPIRIVVPDVDIVLNNYVDGDYGRVMDRKNPKKPGHYPDDPLYHLMCWFFSYFYDKDSGKRSIGGHCCVFNFDTMKDWLSRTGFVKIRERNFDQCLQVFKGCDIARYKKCSLYVEARKP